MTIVYTTTSNWDVLTKIQGSVWPKVLPFCIGNMLITVGIAYLHEHTDIDLTFNGGVGYRYLSVLVSFFTISTLGSTYNRFWEARNHLGTAMLEANMLAARAALYSAHDPSDPADKWRSVLKDNLLALINRALFMIQEDGKTGRTPACTLFNLMDYKTKTLDAGKHGISRTSFLQRGASSLGEEKDVITCAMAVDAVLLTSKEHVAGDGVKNQAELHGRVASIMSAYFNLIKFSTSPRPLIMEQMGRTLTFIWILVLPGAVLYGKPDEIYEALFLVAIVTYGFIGLTLTNVELADPLGNDPNDLETKHYLEIIKCDIEQLLGEKSLSSEGKLLTSAYESGGNGYGSV